MYKLWAFIREQDEWEVVYSVYRSGFCVYCSLALSRTNCHPRAVGDAKQQVKPYGRKKAELQTTGRNSWQVPPSGQLLPDTGHPHILLAFKELHGL